MTSTSSVERHRHLIEKYFIPSVGTSSVESGQLSEILERLDKQGILSREDQLFLNEKGLFDQLKFVQDLKRVGWAGIDPSRPLRGKYKIDHVDTQDMPRLMQILGYLEAGAALAEDDVVWLKTRDHFSSEIRRVFHQNEAELCQKEFEKTGDIWQAINGNSHFRKANQSEKGLALVGSINVDNLQDKHQHSALLTTKGGSYRDLGRLPEALSVAEKAHALNPKSYHPCTLLGAIYYELREFGLGDAWFAKAVERGAKQDVVDGELRSLLRRVGADKQREIADHLLRSDPQRYAWVKSIFRKADGAAKTKKTDRGVLK
jgi:tetratricopeptide (TPR) repeat protein